MTHTEDLVSATNGASTKTQRCSEQVWEMHRYFQCAKSASKEHEGKSYCGTHYPPAVKARREKADAKWKAKFDADSARLAEQRKRLEAYPKLVQALAEMTQAERAKPPHEMTVREQSAFIAAERLLSELGEL